MKHVWTFLLSCLSFFPLVGAVLTLQALPDSGLWWLLGWACVGLGYQLSRHLDNWIDGRPA